MLDLTKILFTSDLNTMKRDPSSGTRSIAVPGSFGTVVHTVDHNLGYIPIFNVYMNDDGSGIIWSGRKLFPRFRSSATSSQPDPTIIAWMTTTQLIIRIQGISASTTRQLYWLIYKDYGNK